MIAGDLAPYAVESVGLSAVDARAAAAQHFRSLRESFVNSLGEPFVEVLFGHMRRSRIAYLVVARERRSRRVVAHISATRNIRRFYADFFARNAWPALRCVRRRLGSTSTIRKMVDSVAYPFQPTVSRLPPAEILTISVDPEHRGRRLLGLLYDHLVGRLQDDGVSAAKIVTAGDDAHLHRFLEKRGWVRVHTLRIHREDRSSCIHVARWP